MKQTHLAQTRGAAPSVRRALWVLAGSLLAILGLTGCGKRNDADLEVTSWTLVHPSPNRDDPGWNRGPVIFVDGKFRSAAGNTLYSSADAETWTTSFLPDELSATRLAWSEGQYFVSGNKKCALSTDFVNWSVHDLPGYQIEGTPVRAFGKWFATLKTRPRPYTGVGLFRSNNGDSWRAVNEAECVAFGNDRLVAVGGGINVLWTFTSTDGVKWHKRSDKSQPLGYGLAFANGLFVCVGGQGLDSPQIRTSPDGVTWTERERPSGIPDLLSVSFLNNRFVASGQNGGIAWSMDGIEWQGSRYPIWRTLYTPVFGNGKWIAGGRVPLASSDLLKWRPLTEYRSLDFKKVRYLDGAFWALDKTTDSSVTGSLWHSQDGAKWTIRYRFSFEPQDIAFGNGKLVVIGDREKAAVSGDKGHTWTEAKHEDRSMRSVTFDRGEFHAVGQRWTMRSRDGVGWDVTENGDDVSFYQIASTPYGLMAVGSNRSAPAIYKYSKTGRWSLIDIDRSSTESENTTIAVSGDVVHVGGRSGRMISSSNGLLWSELKKTEEDYTLGYRETSIVGDSMIWISADGKLYRTPSIETPQTYQLVPTEGGELRSLAVGGNLAVAVGKGGTILRGLVEEK